MPKLSAMGEEGISQREPDLIFDANTFSQATNNNHHLFSVLEQPAQRVDCFTRAPTTSIPAFVQRTFAIV